MSLPHAEPEAPTPDGLRSVVAIFLAILALTLPAWAYLAHAWAVADLRRDALDLAAVGDTTLSGRWSPWPDPDGAVLTIRVSPDGSGGDGTVDGAVSVGEDGAEAVVAALGRQRFEPADRADTFRRPADPAADGGPQQVVAVVEPRSGGVVEVHLRREPWTPRDAFPAVLYGATALVGGTVVIARSGTSARHLLGVVTLVLTFLQLVLLVRALWLAGDLIGAFVAATGPITPDRGSGATPDPGLERLRAQVAAVAAPLRTAGAATVGALLPWWLLGSLAAFSPRRRATLVASGLGIVVAALVAVGFEPEGALIRDLLAAASP